MTAIDSSNGRAANLPLSGLDRPVSDRPMSDRPADERIASLSFSTDDLPDAERFDYWRDMSAPFLQLYPVDQSKDVVGFTGRNTAHFLGSMIVERYTSDAKIFVRSSQNVRKSMFDHWAISVTLSGTINYRWGEQEYVAKAGNVTISSLGRPTIGQTDTCERIVLYVPRDMFSEAAARFDVFPFARMNPCLMSLLKGYITNLAELLPVAPATDLPHLVEATKQMITSCIVPSETDVVAATPILIESMRLRASRYIDKHLGEPGLAAAEIGKALGVSRATLYRLFEPVGGVANYIRHRRLVACHAALAKSHNKRLIKTIWVAHGFRSSSDFSRSFRREFGYSPSDVGVEKFVSAAPQRVEETGTDITQFHGWIRSLRA